MCPSTAGFVWIDKSGIAWCWYHFAGCPWKQNVVLCGAANEGDQMVLESPNVSLCGKVSDFGPSVFANVSQKCFGDRECCFFHADRKQQAVNLIFVHVSQNLLGFHFGCWILVEVYPKNARFGTLSPDMPWGSCKSAGFRCLDVPAVSFKNVTSACRRFYACCRSHRCENTVFLHCFGCHCFYTVAAVIASTLLMMPLTWTICNPTKKIRSHNQL